nr:hypothetical protein [uncultured Campylobacter sp.]
MHFWVAARNLFFMRGLEIYLALRRLLLAFFEMQSVNLASKSLSAQI